jgi:hypothetical protein
LRVRGAIDLFSGFRDRELPAQLVADDTLLGEPLLEIRMRAARIEQ